MNEWRRIDSIASVRRGASPRPIGDPRYFGGDVGWVRIVDVTGSKRFLRETEQYLSPLGESLSVRVNPGDLVMSICGTLGRPIVIDMPACIHDGFVQFSNLRDTDTSFLFYALQHAEPAFCAMGQPGTQTNLNTSLVGRHVIFCPEKREQRRIAEILSTLDETIEQTEALIAKYQQIKAGLMHDLFSCGVTPDGKLRPTHSEAPQLYKESPLGWIPKEWDWDYLSNLTLKIVDGVHHTPEYVEHGIPFVTVKNLTACSGIDLTDLNHVTPWDHAMFLKRADPKPGDVLVTKDGTLGVSRIVEDQHPEFSIFVSVAQLRPITTRLRPWMLHCFFDSGAYERQLGRLSAGTGLKHIHLEHFRRFRIPLPSPLEQDAISEVARSVELVLSTEEDHRKGLLKQKHGLMHDLLTGRVRVKVAETEAA